MLTEETPVTIENQPVDESTVYDRKVLSGLRRR